MTTLATFRQSRIAGARYRLANVMAARAAYEVCYADQPHAAQAERTYWISREYEARAALIGARALALCNDDAQAAFALTFGMSPEAAEAKLTAMEGVAHQVAA